MAELITVAAARADGRVALWEKHPDHPGGEVFIGGGTGSQQVARTPAVLRGLAEGRLIEHPKAGAPEPAAAPKGKAGKPAEEAK